MKKILIVLGTILAATAGKVITAESKVSLMKEEQSQNDEIAIGKEQKSEVEEIDLKKLMLYSYLLQITENYNGTKTFCEYLLLKFVYSVNTDDTVTNSVTEEKVKEFLGKMCTKIPSSLEGECKEFVDVYGDAVVAIIVQGIDPSQVCPMLHICLSKALLNMWEKAPKFITKEGDKSSCRLCLLAINHIYNIINRTLVNVEAELYKECNYLPQNFNEGCRDFVKSYSQKLVEIFADWSPLKICIRFLLCNRTKDLGPKRNNIAEKNGEILTSEIPEYPSHIVQPTNILDDGVCMICEFVMQHIAKEIINNKTRDRIEKLIHAICDHLRETPAKYCNEFVDDYVDAIINMLSEVVSRPKEVCTLLGLCKTSKVQIQESVAECSLCRAIISQIDKLLGDSKTDAETEEAVKMVCKYLSADKQNMCNKMVEIYRPSIINMLKEHVHSEKMCNKMALCSSNDYFTMSFNNPHVSRSTEDKRKMHVV